MWPPLTRAIRTANPTGKQVDRDCLVHVVFLMKTPLSFLPAVALILLQVTAEAADQKGAEATKTPVKAVVVGAPRDAEPSIGNIQVTYQDGTTDRWTTKGNAGLPRVAPDGTVGWTVFGPETKIPASYTLRPNNHLVIFRDGKVLCRVEAGLMTVEEWDFIEGGAKFVVKTRGHHGPAAIELHDTVTGKLISSVKAFAENLPEWAVPYRD